MTQIIQMLSENPLFRSYFFYCSILVFKMMFMSAFTGMRRLIYGVFINPEDTILHKVKISSNESVERVRRAHLNDVENIPLFLWTGFAFCLTGPSLAWANFLFKIYTISRVAHTLSYAIMPTPQPSRFLAWIVGYVITGYMALHTLLHFIN